MFGHITRRIPAAAVEAQLPYDAQLIGDGDGLASGDTRTPSCYDVVEPHLAVVARVLRDKMYESVENKLGAPVADAHRALEAQELLRVVFQHRRSHGRHVGTGSETSRSVSVATLT